mmetsp:Transcript_43168/g.105601  ORF Transcript_43168/g.105601 Transcript_43168/m.105601 type:complete len:215 (+) Transcript_43168:62-706(+)
MTKEAVTLAGIAAFLAAVACAIVAVKERDNHSPSALLQETMLFPGTILDKGYDISFPGNILDKAFKYTAVMNRNFYPVNDPTGAVAGYIKVGPVDPKTFDVVRDKGYSRGNVYVDQETAKSGAGPAYLKIGDIQGEAYDDKNHAAYIKYDSLYKNEDGAEYDPTLEPYPGAGSFIKIGEVKPEEASDYLKIGDIKGESYSGGGFLKIGDIKARR